MILSCDDGCTGFHNSWVKLFNQLIPVVIPELLALNNINSVIRTMVPVNILVNILGSTIVPILTNYGGSMIFPGIAKVTLRAGSSARGIELVWDGLVKDCETSLVRNMAPDEVCPAAPSVATKTMKVGSLPHSTNPALVRRWYSPGISWFSPPNLTVAIHGGFHKWI